MGQLNYTMLVTSNLFLVLRFAWLYLFVYGIPFLFFFMEAANIDHGGNDDNTSNAASDDPDKGTVPVSAFIFISTGSQSGASHEVFRA